MKIKKILFDKRYGQFVGDPYDLSKADFHKAGRLFFRSIAKDLSLPRGSYKVRSVLGGDAVLGDVILHHNKFYVCLMQSDVGQGLDILFRTCTSQKDYQGGPNRWLTIQDLKDFKLQEWFLKTLKEYSNK